MKKIPQEEQTMKKICPVTLLVFMCICVLISAALAQTPQQTLTQYISNLQKNPKDYALREKIIKHVQTMSPAPEVPETAERYMARGSAAVKGAKVENDFQDAVSEFEKASLAAPWLPAIYYNLGITQDKAGKYREAIQSLKLYLLAAPDAPDVKAVKNLVYEIEYRQEKAAKNMTEGEGQARVEEKKKGLRDLTGNWYRKEPYDHRLFPYDSHLHYRAEMRGKSLVFIEVIDVPFWDWRRGDQRDFFIVNRLDDNLLIGRLHHYEGVLEMIVSADFKDLELIFNGDTRKTYTRR
jgi:tetratricopeptide (TPR) repeat protein